MSGPLKAPNVRRNTRTHPVPCGKYFDEVVATLEPLECTWSVRCLTTGRIRYGEPLSVLGKDWVWPQNKLLIHPDDLLRAEDTWSLAIKTGKATAKLRVRDLRGFVSGRHGFLWIAVQWERFNCPECASRCGLLISVGTPCDAPPPP